MEYDLTPVIKTLEEAIEKLENLQKPKVPREFWIMQTNLGWITYDEKERAMNRLESDIRTCGIIHVREVIE